MHRIAVLHPVGPRQELHRLVHAVQFAARDRQIARCRRTAGEHHGVELGPQLLGGDVDADVDAALELGALGGHLVETAVDVALLHLEFGDAVAQQAADAVIPFEDRHRMPGARELLGRGQAGRTGPDDGDLLAGALFRWQRNHPALVEGLVDDLDLDLLDRHGILVDAEHARPFTRRRAQPPGELREVVGRVKPLDGVAPPVVSHQVVPFGNQVSQRAPVVAERDTAVHASGRLLAQRVLGEVLVDLFPVHQPQRDRPTLRGLALCVLEEAARIRHRRPP